MAADRQWRRRRSVVAAGARAGLLAAGLALSACGGNVITRWSTEWVDIRPNPTALDAAQADCAEEAARPDAADDAMAYCMKRHGWVAMQDPLLE